MNAELHQQIRHLRALQESVPLRKVTTDQLLPGDVFEASGMAVVSVKTIENDSENVLLTFNSEGAVVTLTEPIHKHLIRRPAPQAP